MGARGRALLVGNSVDVEVSVPRSSSPRSPRRDFYGERPVHWFRLDLLNEQAWDFGFLSSETIARLNGGHVWGVTLPGHHAALLCTDLAWPENRAKLEEITLHELGHIAWNRPGTTARVFGGRSGKTADDREEAACETLSVALARPLCAAGIFRLPPVPAAARRSR